MDALKIGIMVESLRLGVKQGIEKCAQIGADGVQIYATSGDLDPDNLTLTGRKDLLHLVKSNNLVISALCGDLGGHGFENADDNGLKIEKSKKILQLARDLETKIVTTHVGVIPEDENAPERKAIEEACEELGSCAEAMDASFAIETGPEKVETLKGFLDSLKCAGVRVNYDPANLVMVAGDDPAEGVSALKDYIVHTHAKDGVCLKSIDPKLVYGFFAEGGMGDLKLDDYFREVPLGEGQVDFDSYIGALREAGYNGFYTIEREVGPEPVKDIVKAVEFLRKF